MSSSSNELVSTLIALTGCNDKIAKRLLDGAGGDLNIAMNQ